MNKRQRKKQQVKKEKAVLRQVGFSDKDIKNLTVSDRTQAVKKANRTIYQRERRARNLEGWRALGIDSSIISQYDLRSKNPDTVANSFIEQIKKDSRNAKAAATRARNYEIRRQKLYAAGYTDAEIQKNWLSSDKRLYEILRKTNPRKVYNANKHLALCFTNLHGATNIWNTAAYRDLTFEEIKERIRQRVSDANEDPDDSASMTCVFQMFAGSESECAEMLDAFNERGYNLKINKLTDRRYFRLTNRNDWTMREFAEMTLCIIEQSHNKDVPHLMDELKHFVEESDLPFDEIFS